MINVYSVKEILRKINDELYVTCSIFLNIKRKCTMEMKIHVKLPKNRCKI